MARRDRKQPTPTLASLRDDSRLQGLKTGDINHLEESLRRQFADSLNLDDALHDECPAEPRWDYLLGHGPSRTMVGIEVRPACGPVSDVIAKKQAACLQLRPHHQLIYASGAITWVYSC